MRAGSSSQDEPALLPWCALMRPQHDRTAACSPGAAAPPWPPRIAGDYPCPWRRPACPTWTAGLRWTAQVIGPGRRRHADARYVEPAIQAGWPPRPGLTDSSSPRTDTDNNRFEHRGSGIERLITMIVTVHFRAKRRRMDPRRPRRRAPDRLGPPRRVPWGPELVDRRQGVRSWSTVPRAGVREGLALGSSVACARAARPRPAPSRCEHRRTDSPRAR